MAEPTTQSEIECRGQCMCGEVKFRATVKSSEVAACHCSMCQRWSGGVFMAIQTVGDLKFDSAQTLGVYQSSEWGERGFCSKCGTSLFWRARDGSHSAVSPQTLDDLEHPVLTHEIFIDAKPTHYNFAEATHKMTGAEVFAMFSSKTE